MVVVFLVLALGLAACGPRDAKAPEPPLRLADTGLYADFATRRLAADVLPFAPQYPLWSDGARKRRWIRLPAGTAIDATDPERWEFPVGTTLWKEFAFDRAVETRYLHHRAPGEWVRATYVWTADGTDAVLAPEDGIAGAAASAPGVPYDVPARGACAACHDGGLGPVLGFSALQLSPDRDPNALHAEAPPPGAVDLATLVERGLVRGLPPRVLAAPPRIAARSADERAVLGYLHGNCSACHNPRGPLAPLDLSFAHSLANSAASHSASHPARSSASSSMSSSASAAAPQPAEPAPGGHDAASPPDAVATTVGRSSRFRPHPRQTDCVRVAAGDPEHSVLLQRLGSRNPLLQMPPLATRRVDDDAVQLVTSWIRALPELASVPAFASPIVSATEPDSSKE